MNRHLTLLIVCAALMGCPSDDGDKDSGDTDTDTTTPTPTASPTPTATQSALSIDSGDLTFTHTYQVTACPQVIGSITVTNSSSTEATIAVVSDSTLIEVDPTTTVAAGETVTLEVRFNCSGCPGDDGLTATITTTVTNGTETNVSNDTVSGTFVDCPPS